MEKLIKSKNGQWSLLSGPQSVKEALSTLSKGNVLNFPVKPSADTGTSTPQQGEAGVAQFTPRPEDVRREHNARVTQEAGKIQVPGNPDNNMNNLQDKLQEIDHNAPRVGGDEHAGYQPHGLSPQHENMIKKYVLEGYEKDHGIHDHVKDIEVAPHSDGSHIISVLHNKVHPDRPNDENWSDDFLTQLQDNASLLGRVRGHEVTNFPGNRQLSRIKVDLRKPDSDKKTLTDKGVKYEDMF